MELKILYSNLDKTITEGLQKAVDYAQRCGADEAHLVIFNRDPEVSWEAKIWHEPRVAGDYTVQVWGV